MISVLLRLDQDFVLRKLVRKQRNNIHVALRRFRKICCLSQYQKYSRDNSKVNTFLPGPLLK